MDIDAKNEISKEILDMHTTALLEEYEENKDIFEKMKEFVLEYLRNLICVDNKIFIGGIEGRVKALDSLKGKLLLKGHKYKNLYDITDIFGARIITFYADQVDFIATLIEKNFEIDYENSIDKRKLFEVDRFGYMSLHYVCKIPKLLFTDGRYPKINDFRFEIQIRTELQHVWATIFHDTGYKTDVEVPKEYIRRLARLEGLLEIADDEFLFIRNEIDEYRKKIRSLVSKGKFKDISFNIDSYRNYLALHPFMPLVEKIASITGAEIELISLEKYYEVFIGLGVTMLQEVEQMRVENSDDAYKLSLIQLAGTDIDIISSSIAIRNILIVYIIKKGGGHNEIKKALTTMYGRANIVSDASVDKIIEQAKGIMI